jgi:hypothetical protein
MKRPYSTFSLVMVISLLLGVIWLSPAFAVAPSFLSLGQIEADSLRVPGAMDLDGSGNLYVADNRDSLLTASCWKTSRCRLRGVVWQ